MKNLILVLLVLISGSSKVFAQENYTQEYGKVTQYEMSMTEYEPDREAEAVVIYEMGENYFQGDYNTGYFFLHMEKRSKIKILKPEGLQYANIEIPYYREGRHLETIADLEATVYNDVDGSLTKTQLNSKNIFEEKINDNLYVKKIALSDVREGSVIEFKYSIITPFYVHLRKWEFQKKIPVIYSNLSYRAIPYYEYTYILKGTNKFDRFDSKIKNNEFAFGRLTYKEIAYNFGIDNLPAFRDEEYITSPKDYMVALDFQLSKIYDPWTGNSGKEYISTWPAMCNDFLKDENFGKYIKNSEKEGKNILPTLNLENKSQLKQAQIITQYVKSMYSWDNSNTKYTSDKLSNFLKQKTGNSADINLFLTGLLKSAQIEANPVILSTRDNGSVSKTHPFRHFFNYVIVEATIDEEKFYIDATDPLLNFDQLPERCINIEGLVVKPKNEEWIFTESFEPSLSDKTMNISIVPDQNKIDVDAHYITSGRDAYYYKSTYFQNTENLKDVLEKRNNLLIKDEVVVKDKSKEGQTFDFSFEFSLPLERTADKLFIKPFCNLELAKNPFQQNSRTLPVDLVYIQGDKYKSIIEIPEGYEVEYIPKEVKHNGTIISISYTSKQYDNKLEITAEYQTKNNMFEAKNYQNLKNTFDLIVKQMSEMIVLSKKKGVS